jgi:hypothetical protein
MAGGFGHGGGGFRRFSASLDLGGDGLLFVHETNLPSLLLLPASLRCGVWLGNLSDRGGIGRDVGGA